MIVYTIRYTCKEGILMQILLRALLIVVILIIIIAVLINLYLRARPLRDAHFICPYCGNIATPGLFALSISPVRANSHLLQCDSCKRFGYMLPVWDA